MRSDVEALVRSMLPVDWSIESISKGQSLWADFGSIYSLRCSSPDSEPSHQLILKLVSPPTSGKSSQDESTLRKLYSYEIEQYFYSRLVPLMQKSAGQPIAVARCFGSTLAQRQSETSRKQEPIALLLEDLRPRFPRSPAKRGVLDQTQVYAALRWLARFHGFWWRQLHSNDGQQLLREEDLVLAPLEEVVKRQEEPQRKQMSTVWANGGYTYLATRRKEYANLKSPSDWSRLSDRIDTSSSSKASVAELVASHLSSSSPSHAPFATLLHGDVKSENFFTSEDGQEAAFFDFQYVGVGMGACDLAKLLTCSVSEEMLGWNSSSGATNADMCKGEEKMLRYYLDELKQAAGPGLEYDWELFKWHWELALVDWLRFQAGWGFWGATEWLEARVRGILDEPGWLEKLTTSI